MDVRKRPCCGESGQYICCFHLQRLSQTLCCVGRVFHSARVCPNRVSDERSRQQAALRIVDVASSGRQFSCLESLVFAALHKSVSLDELEILKSEKDHSRRG